jgi:hypothetical protein
VTFDERVARDNFLNLSENFYGWMEMILITPWVLLLG